jgi:hypothetical protein
VEQTKQELVLEAYNWSTLTSLSFGLRNVGSATINIGTTDVFLNGVLQGTGPCTGTLTVQAKCAGSISPTGFTPVSGVAYVLKLVTPDGAVFSYSITAGQAM